MICDICGRRMVHFENPDRDECTTSETEHNRIEATKRRSNQGDHRKGRDSGRSSFDSETGRAAREKRFRKDK